MQSDRVAEVMKQVDRGEFSHVHPYMDAPQGIGYGVTISAPHMVTKMFNHFCTSYGKKNCSTISAPHMVTIVNVLPFMNLAR